MTSSLQVQHVNPRLADLNGASKENTFANVRNLSQHATRQARPKDDSISLCHTVPAAASNETIRTEDWADLAERYLEECELRLFSAYTITTRRVLARNLDWFLHHRGFTHCGVTELRQFFYYLAHGHEEPGGRFGNVMLKSPVRPITIKDYYVALRCMFDWFTTQGIIARSPFLDIPKPRARDEVKMALSRAQIAALLQAAQSSSEPKRDSAILAMLLDTGCRVSELVSIRIGDLDMGNGCCRVLGKGNKVRMVYFGSEAGKALCHYRPVLARHRSIQGRSGDRPLFMSKRTGEPLQARGLQELMRRLKKQCGIRTSCSPHAFRRAFAVEALRNGANVFSVQAMLGHSHLEMTQRYCVLAQADVEAQHRQFSPMDRLVSAL